MSGKILMKGNEAIAEAAIRAGCKAYFGYPITPQTEIIAYMSREMPKRNGVCLQAESEIGAANMVLGAAAAGTRVMTSSSSPGVALMSEAISYLVGSDLPCLLVNIQRGGPGLGGIQPAQSDYNLAVKAPGHGDLKILVFAPFSVQEMVDMVFDAFRVSEKYRVPAMILADGLLGQMMEPIIFPNEDVEIQKKEWAVSGHKNKRKNNIVNSLALKPEELEKKVDERFERYKIIEKEEVMYEEKYTDDMDILVIAYGVTARIVSSAIDMSRKENIKVGILRPKTLWPFPTEIINSLSKKVKKVLVVEMSKGQMLYDVKLSVSEKTEVDFFGHTGGIIPTQEEIFEKIKQMEGR